MNSPISYHIASVRQSPALFIEQFGVSMAHRMLGDLLTPNFSIIGKVIFTNGLFTTGQWVLGKLIECNRFMIFLKEIFVVNTSSSTLWDVCSQQSFLLLLNFLFLSPQKGPFNNNVDKMRGDGVKKCLFLSTLRAQIDSGYKNSTQGRGVQTAKFCPRSC